MVSGGFWGEGTTLKSYLWCKGQTTNGQKWVKTGFTEFWSQPVDESFWDKIVDNLIILDPFLWNSTWTHTSVRRISWVHISLNIDDVWTTKINFYFFRMRKNLHTYAKADSEAGRTAVRFEMLKIGLASLDCITILENKKSLEYISLNIAHYKPGGKQG